MPNSDHSMKKMLVSDSDFCGKMGRTQYMKINSVLVTIPQLVYR